MLFLERLKRLILRILRIILDFILFVSFLPITIILAIILFLQRKKDKTKTVFFLGLEHIINKTLVRSQWFEEQGYKVLLFSYEIRKTEESIKSNNKVIKNSAFSTIGIIQVMLKLLKQKPIYVELYSSKPIRSIVFSILCRISNTLCIFNLRGLYTKIKSQCILARTVDYVFYRELYMPEILLKNRVKKDKLIYDYNKVNVKPLVSYDREAKNVLFLNGFKKWRNIDLVIKSAIYVKKEVPDVQYYLVGARGESEINYAKIFIEEEGVYEYITIEEWTDNPEKYYEKASVFVLPADLIFCNFSLLEAMERGVPAIVANVEDADKIIIHNVNGFLADKDPKEIAKYIKILLTNEELRQKMGADARKTIIENYNHKDRMEIIMNLIKKVNINL